MKALVYDITPARWIFCKALSPFVRRIYYGRGSALRLVDRPLPELPGPDWVRLRTILGGVCGTDLAMITQRTHPATILRCFASFPAVLGHENVAIIDDVGPGVSRWKPGTRVCVEPAIGCEGRGIDPPCRQCAVGRSSLCECAGNGVLPARALVGLNARTGGSWAEYFVAHQSQLHAVPEGIADELAVLVDPIASAAHAVLRRPPRAGETVLVNGSGIIALGIIASIRAMGHGNAITAIMRHAFQIDLARRLGATEALAHPRGARSVEQYDAVARHVNGVRVDGRFGNRGLIGGFDLTYECTGTGRGLTDALKWTRSRGTLVAAGTSGITLVDTTPIWFDELEIIGTNGRQMERVNGEAVDRLGPEARQGRAVHTYEVVFEWMRAGMGSLSAIPVRRFRLSEYRVAFDHLLARGRHPIVKAVFEP
jgi:threonine dehydrogenase-like Zn-dependent dehydrogenase